MSTLNKHMYTLLLTATIAATTSTYSMENEGIDTLQQNEEVISTTCNRKKIFAAVTTCAAVAYTVAVYMNKVASPIELWKNLFIPVVPQTIDSDETNNDDTNVINDSTHNDSDVVIIENNQNEVSVVVETVSKTQVQRSFEIIFKKFSGLKYAGFQKFEQLYDAWHSTK